MVFNFSEFKIPTPVKLIFKLTISVAIILLILEKIDEKLLWKLITGINPLYIVWAILWFAFSKFISANRFNILLQTENIKLRSIQNIKLYLLCMYYNLLLPGGISGDAFKIKVLMDYSGQAFKKIFTITLLDRLSGLIALLQVFLFLLLFIPRDPVAWYIFLPAFLLSFVMSYLLFKWMGSFFLKVWKTCSLQSLAVQISQAIATLGLIFALAQSEHWASYLELFLLSSIIAMIPITIGGAGARELTFLYGSQFLEVDAEIAVAIGFLFYLISTGVSLTGIIFSFHKDFLTKLKEE